LTQNSFSLDLPLVSHTLCSCCMKSLYCLHMSVFNYTVVQVLLTGWVGNYGTSSVNKEASYLFLSRYCIRVTVTVVCSQEYFISFSLQIRLRQFKSYCIWFLLWPTGDGQNNRNTKEYRNQNCLCWLHWKNITCIFHYCFVCLHCVVPVLTHYR